MRKQARGFRNVKPQTTFHFILPGFSVFWPIPTLGGYLEAQGTHEVGEDPPDDEDASNSQRDSTLVKQQTWHRRFAPFFSVAAHCTRRRLWKQSAQAFRALPWAGSAAQLQDREAGEARKETRFEPGIFFVRMGSAKGHSAWSHSR